MAEKIVKFLLAGFPGKTPNSAAASHDQRGHHPFLALHKGRVSPEQAQRLGQFALQFLH